MSWSFAVRPRAWCTIRRRGSVEPSRPPVGIGIGIGLGGFGGGGGRGGTTVAAGVDTEVAIG